MRQQLNQASTKNRKEALVKGQVKFLVLNGYPHDLTQKPEFKELLQIIRPDFQPIARRTYVEGVRGMFN